MANNLLTKNIHAVERWLRLFVGLFLLSLIFWGPHSWWGLLGFIPLVTALVGSCPLYTLLGITTCRRCEIGA